jgi:hypothetical protein
MNEIVLAVLLMTTTADGRVVPQWQPLGKYRSTYACEQAKREYLEPNFGLRCLPVSKD